MTEPGRCEPPPQIPTLVARGFSSLKTLIGTLADSPTECSTAESHLARLKLWAANLGAHRPSGTRSLEYRLRDASSIRNHIVSLLQDLCKAIDEGVSVANGDFTALDEGREDPTDIELAEYFQDDSSQDDSEVGRILTDIGHTVDCLLRLSTAIRTPAPHDRFKSRAGTDVVELFEHWDTKHVQDKFPATNVRIAERLGRAAARRRQYFKYREEHSAKLAEGLEALDTGDQDDQHDQHDQDKRHDKATTVASSIPNHFKDSFSESAGFIDDTKSEVSGTSYALSMADTTKLRVPPMPKEHAAGPFKCPFCCMVVSIETRREWKKHVFRDLQPYICLANSCQAPENQYSRRSDWINHMRQDHWRTWNCPFGCQTTYPTDHEFEEHVKKCHHDEAAAKNLDSLKVLSSHPDLHQAQGRCPLCFDFQITSDRQYSSHVADHLESLALFALPDTGPEEEGSPHDSDDSLHGSEGSLHDIEGKQHDSEDSDTNAHAANHEPLEMYNPGELSDSDESSTTKVLKRHPRIKLLEYLVRGRPRKKVASGSIGSHTESEDLGSFLGAEEAGSSARRLGEARGYHSDLDSEHEGVDIMDPPIELTKQQDGTSESEDSKDSKEDTVPNAEANDEIEHKSAQGIEPSLDNDAKPPNKDESSFGPTTLRRGALWEVLQKLLASHPSDSEKRRLARQVADTTYSPRAGEEPIMAHEISITLPEAEVGSSASGELGAEAERLKVDLPREGGQSIGVGEGRRRELSHEEAKERAAELAHLKRELLLERLRAEPLLPKTESQVAEDAALHTEATNEELERVFDTSLEGWNPKIVGEGSLPTTQVPSSSAPAQGPNTRSPSYYSELLQALKYPSSPRPQSIDREQYEFPRVSSSSDWDPYAGDDSAQPGPSSGPPGRLLDLRPESDHPGQHHRHASESPSSPTSRPQDSDATEVPPPDGYSSDVYLAAPAETDSEPPDAVVQVDPYMTGSVDEGYPAGEVSSMTPAHTYRPPTYRPPTYTTEGRELTSGAHLECPFEGCTSVFSRQFDLDKHMNSHTKPWKKEKHCCLQCGYSGRKDNVKRHKDRNGHW